MTARTLATAALVALVGSALAQPKPADLPAPKAAAKAEKPDIPARLATRVSVEKFEGNFKDAVKMLAEKYDLSLVIDPRLGEGEAMAMCEAPAETMEVRLPKLANVRLDTVLNLLAEQVHGKLMTYPDHVKIVPDLRAAYESGVLTESSGPNDEVPFLHSADLVRARPLIKRALVNASFKSKPLAEVLDEIAEATGANVALSPLLPANVRQAPVTVRFANTPVDAAVRTLCEMTECGVIEDANVLLVTTRERAAARVNEDAEKVRAKQPPDLANEWVKMKEQNEQLRRQVEELQKQLKKLSEK